MSICILTHPRLLYTFLFRAAAERVKMASTTPTNRIAPFIPTIVSIGLERFFSFVGMFLSEQIDQGFGLVVGEELARVATAPVEVGDGGFEFGDCEQGSDIG